MRLDLNVQAEVYEIIRRILGVPMNEIKPEARLIEDLNADSLDAVDLADAIEERFELEILDSELIDYETVGEIIAAIERKRQHG